MKRKDKRSWLGLIALLAMLFLNAGTSLASGILFIADDIPNAGVVYEFDLGSNSVIHTFATGGVPHSIAENGNNSYFGLAGQDQIDVYTGFTKDTSLLTTPDTGQNISPQSITMHGNDVVAATYPGPIQVFTNGSGNPTTIANIPGARGITYDPNSNGFVITTQVDVKWVSVNGGTVKTILPASSFGPYPQGSGRSDVCSTVGTTANTRTCYSVDTAWAFDPNFKEGRIWKYDIDQNGDVVANTTSILYHDPVAGTNGITYNSGLLFVTNFFEGTVYSVNAVDGSNRTNIMAGLTHPTTILFANSGIQADTVSMALYTQAAEAASTPEPSSIILFSAGIAGIMVVRRAKARG